MSAPARRPGSQPEPAAAPIRLLLSGGGHRATIGSLGAVAYLAHSGRWSDVDEVVSVSGGSMANAALATACQDEDIWSVVGTAVKEIDQDYGRVFANKRRGLIFARYAMGLLVVLGVVGLALGLGPSVPSAASFLVGALAIPVFARIAGLCANALTRDFIEVVSSRRDAVLSADEQSSRAHIFCASGLSSGAPYLLWTGRPFTPGSEPTWGTTLQAPYTVVDAALASVSLPLLGRVRSPRDTRTASGALSGGEILVDGGVSGIFGDQVMTPFRRTPADTHRAAPREFLAIDAGRHLSSPPPLVRTLERFSVSATLMRWLKASLEATYVNDLVDLAPSSLVRICEDDRVIGPVPGDDNAEAESVTTTGMSPALALRLAPAPSVAAKVPAEVTTRLASLREQVAGVSLMNVNSERISTVLTTGFVATMVKLDPPSSVNDVFDALVAAEQRLNLDNRLSAVWEQEG